MNSLWRAALLLLLLPVSLLAQTATPGSKLLWDLPGQTATVAQSASYRLYVDTGTPISLTGVTCVTGTVATTATCSTAGWPAMTPGPHTLTVTQTMGGVESSQSVALSVTLVIVVTPTNVRIGP
jgi:hypothetical protein